jgi:hypothetical protein
MNPDSHDLIQRHMAGLLTDDEGADLQTRLKADTDLRRLYLHYMNLDVALEAQAGSRDQVNDLLRAAPLTENKPSGRWYSWRPLTAAAAGIAIGIFCTSVVFGFVVQRQMRTQTLLSEGFEDAGMPVEHGLPQRAGVWSGDLSAPETDNANARPAEGSRMVRLPPVDKRKFSYAMRFMEAGELPPSGTAHTRQIEVTASFHGDGSPVSGRYQIRMAAFAGTLTEAREIWLGGHVDEQALMHVARTISTAPSQHGWTPVRTEMEVPAQTRWVLISLAAAVADEAAAKTAHYLDDVQIRVITHDAQP